MPNRDATPVTLADERVDHPDDAHAGVPVIALPDPALVVLVGASGAGKSRFARAHFAPTEIVGSDACRALVCDDENDQSATAAAFELVHLLVDRRLARGRTTVVDATNVQPEARAPLLDAARRHHVTPVAIVLDMPESLCAARDAVRTDRTLGPHVIHRQHAWLARSRDCLAREGFRRVHVLASERAASDARVVRRPLLSDRTALAGPFDIVGDVHGCGDELEALLSRLGWHPGPGAGWHHPAGRTLVFVGDLVDRGPRVVEVLRLAMAMTAAGTALCVPGNHDDKLRRKLIGRNVQVAHGLAESLAQLAREPAAFRDAVATWIDALPSHLRLDGGALVVAHAGLVEAMQGRSGPAVRDFALYGLTTGALDEHGLPVRLDWAADHRGDAHVVYGHTPVGEPRWVHRTIDIDTGCVFGHRLTALRWPERELVWEPARRTYAVSRRPFTPGLASAVGAAAATPAGM
jgi:protein phosphatase